MSLITINVTAKDITHGIRRNCHRCPVALAIKRRLKAGYYAGVSAVVHLRRIADDNWRVLPLYRTETPAAAWRFITTFDGNLRGIPKPFRFSLNIPKQYLKATA